MAGNLFCCQLPVHCFCIWQPVYSVLRPATSALLFAAGSWRILFVTSKWYILLWLVTGICIAVVAGNLYTLVVAGNWYILLWLVTGAFWCGW